MTLPKLMAPALRVRLGIAAEVPVPLSLTVTVLPEEELLEMVTAPAADPGAVGSKLTCSVNDWPGFRVAGNVPLVMANPKPDAVTELMVSAAVPDEVNVSGLVEMVLAVTLPKLMEPELRVRVGAAAVMPVPLSATAVELLEAELLAMVTVPVAAPATLGSKLTCRVTD